MAFLNVVYDAPISHNPNRHWDNDTDCDDPIQQICITNMLAKAPVLGCPLLNGQPDRACLCTKPDFGFGVRDCASEACPPDQAMPVIAYGFNMCVDGMSIPLSHFNLTLNFDFKKQIV